MRTSQATLISLIYTFYLQSGAETCLAAYETLVPVLNTVCCSFSPLAHQVVASYNKSTLLQDDGGSFLDPFVNQFFKNVNSLLALGVLAQSRKAILMDWKVFILLLWSLSWCNQKFNRMLKWMFLLFLVALLGFITLNSIQCNEEWSSCWGNIFLHF